MSLTYLTAVYPACLWGKRAISWWRNSRIQKKAWKFQNCRIHNRSLRLHENTGWARGAANSWRGQILDRVKPRTFSWLDLMCKINKGLWCFNLYFQLIVQGKQTDKSRNRRRTLYMKNTTEFTDSRNKITELTSTKVILKRCWFFQYTVLTQLY